MQSDARVRSDWDGAKGDVWVRRQSVTDAFLAPFGHVAMRAAGVRLGESVIDVGCGCGASTLDLAAEVGARGRVVGIDVSQVMLDVARGRNADAGFAARTAFVHADAATHAFESGKADVLYSRFGVMFFAEPLAAFVNLRRAMRPGGRLAFVCWQSDARNAWKSVPYAAALQVLPSLPPRDPEASGGSSFASRERVERILRGSGWSDVRLDSFTCNVTLGDTLDEALDEVAETALFGDLINSAAPEPRARALAAARAALQPYASASGVVLGAAAWIVTARS